MKSKMIKMSLLGSASALGTNWIYDEELMKSFSKNNDLLFLPIQHDLYKKAKNGFNVYSDFKVGDVDFMGHTVLSYYKFLQEKNTDFQEHLYKDIGPNSSYTGYIEHYGKELIKNVQEEKNEPIIDKQLIGPSMFIVGYSMGLTDDEILEHTQYVTQYKNTSKFFKTLRYIFDNIKIESKSDTLKKSIDLLPNEYKENVTAALTDIELTEFIKNHSGVACGMDQSIPLIYYIISNTKDFKEALQLNASLSGASCARGIVIGAIYSILEDVPIEYREIL